MSGYCPDCGNQHCICGEIETHEINYPEQKIVVSRDSEEILALRAALEAAEKVLICVPYNDPNFRNVYLAGMDEAVAEFRAAKKKLEEVSDE